MNQLDSFVSYHTHDCIYVEDSDDMNMKVWGRRCTCGRDEAAAELVALRASLAEAVAMLKRLEWADDEHVCPVCASDNWYEKHTPGCELAALIERLEKQK